MRVTTRLLTLNSATYSSVHTPCFPASVPSAERVFRIQTGLLFASGSVRRGLDVVLPRLRLVLARLLFTHSFELSAPHVSFVAQKIDASALSNTNYVLSGPLFNP